ncbi:protein-export chaperone SecB [Alisedimentitalea sp. MJ-SS2]|uniref:protein-export chaperone SecB n=1 Tax=Aliisedimentitalea sp. MJ-SS2 TaxID=3049795 RepID=UPI002910FB93|nr:protein-export chaperone SecB [Alisedimentitalea sp. MJ-SS2]MDU8927961.1 protein-export chaperone SecB [Alisedimentitalea sp. MJ-SS2]
MAETGNGADQAPQIQLNVVNQYVRDLSFENILAQKGGQGEVQPDIQVQVNLDAKEREGDNQYEVSIKLNIENRDKENAENKIFLMEIDYAGLFFIAGVPDDQMHPFLLIECPRLLFPFLRRIVSDISRDGGFPPLNLDNIDFMGLYRQEIARRQAEAGQAPVS